MISFEIKNRFSHHVQVTACIDCEDSVEMSLKRGLAVKWAIQNGANLEDADLRGAYLGDADLGGADFAGADLGGAYLGDAYLAGANLAGANLAGAYLGGADFGDANLRNADLGDAYLGDAYLGGADLRGAYLGDADLAGVYLAGADLRDADLEGLWLSQGPTRNDGYDYKIWSSVLGGCVITAGCRTWIGSDAITLARQHSRTGTEKCHRAQALRILDYLESEYLAYRENIEGVTT